MSGRLSDAGRYVLSFGIDGVTGFLKKSELPAPTDKVETTKGVNPLLEMSARDNDAPEAEQVGVWHIRVDIV